MAGFEFAYNINGSSEARIIEMVAKNAVVITKGMMIEVESGEADYGVSGSTTLIGVAAEACDNTSDGEKVKVYDGWTSVFKVTDANARTVGSPLDIGADYITVAANSDSDLVVVEDSTATEVTLVMISPQKHVYYTAT